MVVGSVGAVAAVLALLGVWCRHRPLLLPLLIFLCFTLVLDAVTVFAYFTSVPTEQNMASYWYRRYYVLPHLSQVICLVLYQRTQRDPQFKHCIYIHIWCIYIFIFQDVFFFVVVKLVYSILLLRVILRTFRRNLKFR